MEGQIIHTNGAGHEGVTVIVRAKTDDDGEGKLIGKTITDALGDFVVTAPRPIRGQIVVTFSKPHYADSIRELNVGDDEFPPFIAGVLESELVLIGRVIDANTKAPIAGAHVTLRTRYRDWNEQTGDRGGFTIMGVIPGQGELIVEARGYGRERSTFTRVARLIDSGQIVVDLKPERVVHIKLADDLGKPITGATVECYDETRDDFRTVVTDASGTVTIRGIHLDARTLSIRLAHDDHVSSKRFDRAIVISDEETESTHQLVMARAGRITGNVTDARTGEPLNGARLTIGGDHSDSSPRDWTDYQGRYIIHGVKPGSTVVTAHLSGYAPELEMVEVKADETAHLNIRLSSGAVLKGIVKGEGGKPVPGAYVEAVRWRGHTTLGLRAVTGSNGHFVIESAPRDELEITVSRVGPTFQSVRSVTKTVKATPGGVIEITLPGAPAGSHTPGTNGPNVGDPAPALTLTTLGGETLNFADLTGKTILLSFWATWCPPCIEELPYFVTVREKFATRKDLVMISISRDFDENVLRIFIKRSGKLDWHHVFGEAGGVEVAVEQYGVTSIPRVFIIGPDGKIAAVDPEGEDIVKRVEQVLKDRDPT